MPHRETESHLSVDADGRLTEQIEFDGQAVVIRYDDIPESDITTVNGIRCTTPLRTVIDLAAELDPAELDDIVQECLGRGLFTVEQAMDRTAEPDVASRRGAHALRAYLVR